MKPREIADEIIESGCELELMNDNWLKLKDTDRLSSETMTAYVMNRSRVNDILMEDYQNAENYR